MIAHYTTQSRTHDDVIDCGVKFVKVSLENVYQSRVHYHLPPVWKFEFELIEEL